MPYETPSLKRLLTKLVHDVPPAALASVIGGFLFPHFQLGRFPEPVAAQVTPASDEMMQLLRDEHRLIISFLQSPQGTARANGQTPALEQLVSKKLINPTGQDPPGSLGRALLDNIPPAGTSAATASLYSLSQDDAIQSAQVAVINAINILKNGDFGNQTSSNHN